jgi:hypothetical protein
MRIEEFKSIVPYMLTYALVEGGKFNTLSCLDEGIADYIIEEFKKTGKIKFGDELREVHSLYKVEVKQYLTKI